MIIIRKIQKNEIALLSDFLYEAIFIPEGTALPPRSIIESDDLQIYIRDFGELSHDHCLVAELDGKIVGAVWVRVMNDYGHIDDQTPSLAISLFKDYRSQGIGSRLLQQMMDLLRHEKYKKVSLSVQKENYALKMYQKVGFRIVKDRGGELLMVASLDPKENVQLN